MSHDDPIPVMMGRIKNNQTIPQLLSSWKDCVFITKILYVCAADGIDPLIDISTKLPPVNRQQPGHPIPTSGAFILTLIGKWDDIRKYKYSALKYTVTHVHDHNTNNQATFNALQEMGCHINACLTHPIAQQMIIEANGWLSGNQLDITFGLVTNVDRTQDEHTTTIINPCDRTQHILYNFDPSYKHTPSVGWLCLFVSRTGSNYCYDYYDLPIVDLSQHAQFMTTYDPNDLPSAEATVYNALIDKWQNEQCIKGLSCVMPQPNELNPHIYVEAWNSVLQPIKDAEAKEALEKQRQLEQYIKSKPIQQFEEYQRLLLLQHQSDMYNNLYDTSIKTDINNTPRTITTTNQTSSFISLLNNNLNSNDNNSNSNKHNNNNNTCLSPLSSPAASLKYTLFIEYYYKQYIKSQLDDLKIMNHLQYYQYLSSSGTKYRPRPHIALPLPSSSTTTTTNTPASPTTSTATSTIDTLIDLATSLPPPPPTISTTTALVLSPNNDATNSVDNNNNDNTPSQSSTNQPTLATSLPPQSSQSTTATTTTSLVTYTNTDATNDVPMGDNNDINNSNNTINNINQSTLTIPHQQTTTLNNTNKQQLILLQEQYNNILDQKHILAMQYDDLISKYNNTNKYNNMVLQINETYNKQIIALQQQLTTLEEQLQSSNIKIQTLQDQITALKDEHENEIVALKEEYHRKEIEGQDLIIAAHNNTIDKIYTTTAHNSNNTDTATTEHHHHHIVNNQISFLQQQLQAKDNLYQQQLQSKDKQLESKDTFYQQQITELAQSKDKQLEAKDQQIALLMHMLAEANTK